MTGKTHQLFGIIAALGVVVAARQGVSPATGAAALVGAHFAALLPDIDQSGSTLWRSLPFGRTAAAFVDPFLEHRNLTHSLFGVVLVGWGLHALLGLVPGVWNWDGTLIWWAWMAAYVSHLLADCITEQGIPILFPFGGMMGFPPRPFHGIRILTGQWFENLVLFPLANVVLIVLIVKNWDLLKAILGL